MDFTPMSDKVLVKLVKIERTTKSGLVLSADTDSLDVTQAAEVVAVGPGKRSYTGEFTPVGVEVGQQILFVKDTGLKLMVEGEDLLLIQEEAILGTTGVSNV